MLGRKQSIKASDILADYGNEEMLNESADVEWVNKVKVELSRPSSLNFTFLSAMGSTSHEAVRAGVALLGLPEHTQDLRTLSALEIFHVLLRHHCWCSLPDRDDCENHGARAVQGRESLLQQQVVHLRLLHGAHNLGVGGVASP